MSRPARRGRRWNIEAEAERRKITISAQAEADATRTRAEAQAQAIEQKGRADAVAVQAMKEAHAAGAKAEASALKAHKLAEADGEKAKLLAEAEGRRELAAATAAEGEINLRQFLIEQITNADVAKAEAIAQALAGLGGNVRVVQFGGNGHSGNSTFMDMLMEIPEMAEMFRAKVEALSGEDLQSTVARISALFAALRDVDVHPTPPERIATVSTPSITSEDEEA